MNAGHFEQISDCWSSEQQPATYYRTAAARARRLQADATTLRVKQYLDKMIAHCEGLAGISHKSPYADRPKTEPTHAGAARQSGSSRESRSRSSYKAHNSPFAKASRSTFSTRALSHRLSASKSWAPRRAAPRIGPPAIRPSAASGKPRSWACPSGLPPPMRMAPAARLRRP
jgi:hypothetical protein